MLFPNFLRVASIPFVFNVDINEMVSMQKEVFDHYEAAFTKILSEKLRFSYETVIANDREWGNRQPDGNWTGMVGLVHRDEADLIICTLSMTEERSQVVDFSYPYMIDFFKFATRRLEKSIDKESFLKPFSSDVWIYLCASVLIMPVLYSVLFQRKLSCSHLQVAYRYFLQESVNAPESNAEYILRNSWLIFVTSLRWSYAAVLLSFLTFPSLTGVRNVPELANSFLQGHYQCTTYPGSYIVHGLLKSSDADLRAVGQCVKENVRYPDFDEALNNGKLSKRLAYIGLGSRFIGVEMKYFVSDDGFFPDYRAIGIKKDFCCKAQLDTIVHYIWGSGIYYKLLADYSRKRMHKKFWKHVSEDDGIEQRRLTLRNLQGVFILLLLGYCLAIVVLFVELVYGKK